MAAKKPARKGRTATTRAQRDRAAENVADTHERGSHGGHATSGGGCFHAHHSEPVAGPDPGQDANHAHAFVVVGREQTFLCHMTNLWWRDHMYQLILRVKLSGGGIDELLAREPADDGAPNGAAGLLLHPDTLFVINDAKSLMTIPALKSGVRHFTACVFRGVPDVDGFPWTNAAPVATDVQVHVEDVVYFRPFDLNSEYPLTHTYILFGWKGNGGEAHIAHLQTRQPDFDHVVTLDQAPAWIAGDKLAAGALVNLPDRPWVLPPFKTDPFFAATTAPVQLRVQFQGSRETYELVAQSPKWFGWKVANSHDPAIFAGA